MLQAELHTWNVVIRHTRYRDLAKSIWGEESHQLVPTDPLASTRLQNLQFT
jgi:hypothetical protein